MYNYIENFVYGGIAGACGTLVSQPAFNCKTMIQNNEITSKELYNKIKTNKIKSIKWLYTGWKASIIGASCEKTIVFGVYNMFIKYNDIKKTEWKKMMACGFLSGACASLSTTISEQIAIDMQNNIKNYKLNHLYKGLCYTMIRESIGFAIYVPLFELLQYNYNKQNNKLQTITNASITCTTAWIVVCPIDRLKTLKQKNMSISIKDLIYGYRGFNYAMMRALPFHITTLYVYNMLYKLQKN